MWMDFATLAKSNPTSCLLALHLTLRHYLKGVSLGFTLAGRYYHVPKEEAAHLFEISGHYYFVYSTKHLLMHDLSSQELSYHQSHFKSLISDCSTAFNLTESVITLLVNRTSLVASVKRKTRSNSF